MTTDEIRLAIRRMRETNHSKIPLNLNVVEQLLKKADAYDALIAPQSAKQARRAAHELFRQ